MVSWGFIVVVWEGVVLGLCVVVVAIRTKLSLLSSSLDGSTNLEVVEKFKLLVLQIRSDLKCYDNTDYVCKTGYERLWLLRRLRSLGGDREELLDVYLIDRSILAMAVHVWEPGLTKEESKQIERVQKTACYIIMGDEHTRNMNFLQELGCQTLKFLYCTSFRFDIWDTENWLWNNKNRNLIALRMRSDKHNKLQFKHFPEKIVLFNYFQSH